MTFDQWTNAAGTLGIPAVILMASGLAFWKACRWLASDVIKPIANRHLSFLDALDIAISRVTSMSSQISETLSAQTTAIKSTNEKLDNHGKKIDEIHQAVRK